MLTRIKLENFKCFKELDLKCAPLTLLTGINGTGKSSVFQALMLLHQTVLERDFGDGLLYIKGSQIDLGSTAEILHEDASYVRFALDFYTVDPSVFSSLLEETEFTLEEKLALTNRFDDKHLRFLDQKFCIDESTDQLLCPDARAIDQDLELIVEDEANLFPPLTGDFIYVNADRLGPRTTYPLANFQGRQTGLGQNTELAWSHLHNHQWSLVDDDDPRFEGYVPERLLDVVNQWLPTISPGANIHMDNLPAANQLLASFSFNNDSDTPSRPYRAMNVGFGLSYTLPIIVALLMPKDTLCLIENPEAHLHPQGQTKIAELAARAAKAGMQVMVETHSDHFIDGVRIAVREEILTPDDVAIHYFERQGNESVVRSPVIDSDGRLSEWPAGFFDQHEMNAVKLLGPRGA